MMQNTVSRRKLRNKQHKWRKATDFENVTMQDTTNFSNRWTRSAYQ